MNCRSRLHAFLQTMTNNARPGKCAALVAFFAASCMLQASCSQNGGEFRLPAGDIKPPSILDARQTDPGVFRILFDEDVQAVPESYYFTPAGPRLEPAASGSSIDIGIIPAAPPGQECEISGEARDASGNTCRFLFSFAAYNASPATLVITEIQTGKNSSVSSPHRDYMEFLVTAAGNLGGICIQWASSVKNMEFVFPTCEVKAGDVIVLHCSPEGLASEMNEVGTDLALSGGIDASSTGRDFWSQAGGLPDETGAIAVKSRSGSDPRDGLLYASSDKSGIISEGKLQLLSLRLKASEVWPLSEAPLWEEFFLWKPSSSRPIHRKLGSGKGPDQWYVGESGTQSPGRAEPGIARKQGLKPR